MKHKIAIIHDTCTAMGGAERVLSELIDLFPQADLFTSISRRKIAKKLTKKLLGSYFFSNWLSLIPIPDRWLSLLKPFVLLHWQTLDLSKYDLVISSSHSFSSKAVKISGRTRHISYIHTPPKYLYQEFNEMGWIRWPVFNFLFAPIMSFLRQLDFQSAQKPHLLIANSRTTQTRIKKYYHRNSLLIYPPVKLPDQKKVIKIKRAEYWGPQSYLLCCSQLLRQKGVGLIVTTCNKLNLSLVVVGEGPEKQKLVREAGPETVFMGRVSDHLLSQIYFGARGFLTASVDEDFGITPVEALAHGTPVVGYASGGTRETVINGVNGFLYDSRSVEGLTLAIKKLEKTKLSIEKIVSSAQRFDSEIFRKAFNQIVEKL